MHCDLCSRNEPDKQRKYDIHRKASIKGLCYSDMREGGGGGGQHHQHGGKLEHTQPLAPHDMRLAASLATAGGGRLSRKISLFTKCPALASFSSYMEEKRRKSIHNLCINACMYWTID